MKINTKLLFLKIFIVLVITLTVGLLLYFLINFSAGFKSFRIEGKKAKQRQVRLLCETKHQDLLEACRDISSKVIKGELKKSYYRIRINPDPEISSLPQLILDLNPTYVEVYADGHVMIEMYGLFHHYGVRAYPEYFVKPFSSYYYGDKELVPGLWYYDDGYDDVPEYDKKIEELIQKGK